MLDPDAAEERSDPNLSAGVTTLLQTHRPRQFRWNNPSKSPSGNGNWNADVDPAADMAQNTTPPADRGWGCPDRAEAGGRETRLTQRIKVVQVGLGPIGNQITRYLIRKNGFDLVGGWDLDPAKAGRDLGELAGGPPLGVVVSSDPVQLTESGAAVAVVTTVSSLQQCRGPILQAVRAGLHVVSTCEELAYPWISQPDIAKEIDRAAKMNSVSVLGTGVNPGFLMDFLPVAMSGVCLEVEKVVVERIQDATHRRLPFQAKIGAGLTLQEFGRRVEEKKLRHVGLTESMHMIAARLGWTLDKTEDVIEPVLAKQTVQTADLQIAGGNAVGVSQVGRGWSQGRELIRMVFRATVGEPETYDRLQITGTPNIDIRIAGGVNGDIATCAITVNAIPAIVAAQPGLRTMADIAPISCFHTSGST